LAKKFEITLLLFFVKLHDSFFENFPSNQISIAEKRFQFFAKVIRAEGYEAGLCPYFFFCSDHIFKTIFLNIFFIIE